MSYIPNRTAPKGINDFKLGIDAIRVNKTLLLVFLYLATTKCFLERAANIAPLNL